MESPLLLNLLMEKIGQENKIEKYCRCGLGLKSDSMFSDSLDSISSFGERGGKYSNNQDFLSSPLFDGAKNAIQLRARESGWVKERTSDDENKNKQCNLCYLSKTMNLKENNKRKTTSPEWLTIWPNEVEKGEEPTTIEQYTKYLRKILALAGDDCDENENNNEKQEQKQKRKSIKEELQELKKVHQKGPFTNTKDTFDIHIDSIENGSKLKYYRSSFSINSHNPSTTIVDLSKCTKIQCSKNGLMKKIKSLKNRKIESKFPFQPIQFETIREFNSNEEEEEEFSGHDHQQQQNNGNLYQVLAAGPRKKNSTSTSNSTSFLFKQQDLIEYGLAS